MAAVRSPAELIEEIDTLILEVRGLLAVLTTDPGAVEAYLEEPQLRSDLRQLRNELAQLMRLRLLLLDHEREASTKRVFAN